MKNTFAKNNNKFFYWIVCPIIGIFFLNILFFIISSFFDYEIMRFFEKGMKYQVIKYIAVFYNNAGNSELFVVFIVAVYMLLEYLINYLHVKKGWNKELWTWSSIVFSILVYAGIAAYLLISKFYSHETVMSEEGVELFSIRNMTTVNDYIGMSVFIFVYQLGLLIGLLLYIKLSFTKRNNFYEARHWVGTLKLIGVFVLTYFVVASIKLLMGRDYYLGMEEVLLRRQEYWEYTFEFKPEWVSSGSEIQPWWEPTGLIGNPSAVDWSMDKIFEQFAFPSGHMAANTVIGMSFIYIINPKNTDPKHLSKTKIIGFYLYLFNCFMMQFTFLINGWHWLSDTSFTVVWAIICVYLSNVIIDKILIKIQQKIDNKKQNSVEKKS